MKRGLVLAAFSLSLAATGPAMAQLAPTYSGTSSAPTTASQDEYWWFMTELGRCLAKTKRAKSIALLATTGGSAGEKAAFDALFDPNGNNACMRNMASAGVVRAQVRGVIAEALYEMGTGPQHAGALLAASSAQEQRSALDGFADCYVAAHAGEARSLLADTYLGSKAERLRVRAMAAGFGPCLPHGQEVRLQPMNVRIALAQALYRTAMVSPSAGSAR